MKTNVVFDVPDRGRIVAQTSGVPSIGEVITLGEGRASEDFYIAEIRRVYGDDYIETGTRWAQFTDRRVDEKVIFVKLVRKL